MKEVFLKNSINAIEKYQKLDNDSREKIMYGLEGLYITLTKSVVLLLLAFFLGIIKEIIIILLLFNILRFTGFGFHANSSIECLFMSAIVFIFIPFILLTLSMSKYLILILGIFNTIYIFIYAPADTIKRPLPNVKKRFYRKIITTIESVVFMIVGILTPNYDLSILLLSALIIESIMISPITYKLFKQPYRNYLNYKKA